jgi:hypothetical protein
VRKDGLKPPPGSLPIPSELKEVVKKAQNAYDKGDTRVRESAAAVPRQLVFVAKEDLKSRAISEKALTWDKVPKQGAPAAGEGTGAPRVVDPRREAARVYRGIDGPAAAPRRTPEPGPKTIQAGGMTAVPNPATVRTDVPEASRSGRPGPTAARFRDWNPDMKVARELGVHIEYSSMRNEIRCPELKISSRDREQARGMSPRMTPDGVRFGPAAGGGDYSSGPGTTSSSSDSSSASSASGKAQPERASGSSGAKETKGGGSEGGKIKN